MSDGRKNPLWPWIVTVLIGLPVLYVASFGPACWLVAKKIVEPKRVATCFSPVISLMATSEAACQAADSILSINTSAYYGFADVCTYVAHQKHHR